MVEVLASIGALTKPPLPVKAFPVDVTKKSIGKKGEVYLVVLQVSGVNRDNAGKALNMLREELGRRFGIRTLFGTATSDRIVLEIMGSPFSWGALLALLPTILSIVGIALLTIGVWQVVASIPDWVWLLLIVGGVILFFGPALVESAR